MNLNGAAISVTATDLFFFLLECIFGELVYSEQKKVYQRVNIIAVVYGMCVCVIRKHLVIDTYAGCAWIGIQYLPYAYETEQNEGPMLYGSSWHCIDKKKNTLKCGKRLAIWMFKVEYEWIFNKLLLLRATQLYVLSRQRSIHWMEREKKNGQLQKSCIFCSLKLKWWKRSTVCPWEVKEKEDRQRGGGEREEGEVKREKVSRSWFFFHFP